MFSPFHFIDLTYIYGIVIFLFLLRTNNWLLNLKFKKNINKVLILLIGCVNLISLNPYTWSITGYMWNNLLVALSICLRFVVYSVINKFNIFISHLLPLGRPIFLWNIIVILEIVSVIIRPLTLSLRLTCNILAGHVLISLIINLSLLGRFFLIFLLLFESIIGYIQSYVFSILSFIYFSEHK